MLGLNSPSNWVWAREVRRGASVIPVLDPDPELAVLTERERETKNEGRGQRLGLGEVSQCNRKHFGSRRSKHV